jgi:hypothetical protein
MNRAGRKPAITTKEYRMSNVNDTDAGDWKAKLSQVETAAAAADAFMGTDLKELEVVLIGLAAGTENIFVAGLKAVYLGIQHGRDWSVVEADVRQAVHDAGSEMMRDLKEKTQQDAIKSAAAATN